MVFLGYCLTFVAHPDLRSFFVGMQLRCVKCPSRRLLSGLWRFWKRSVTRNCRSERGACRLNPKKLTDFWAETNFEKGRWLQGLFTVNLLEGRSDQMSDQMSVFIYGKLSPNTLERMFYVRMSESMPDKKSLGGDHSTKVINLCLESHWAEGSSKLRRRETPTPTPTHLTSPHLRIYTCHIHTVLTSTNLTSEHLHILHLHFSHLHTVVDLRVLVRSNDCDDFSSSLRKSKFISHKFRQLRRQNVAQSSIFCAVFFSFFTCCYSHSFFLNIIKNPALCFFPEFLL